MHLRDHMDPYQVIRRRYLRWFVICIAKVEGLGRFLLILEGMESRKEDLLLLCH